MYANYAGPAAGSRLYSEDLKEPLHFMTEVGEGV